MERLEAAVVDYVLLNIEGYLIPKLDQNARRLFETACQQAWSDGTYVASKETLALLESDYPLEFGEQWKDRVLEAQQLRSFSSFVGERFVIMEKAQAETGNLSA